MATKKTTTKKTPTKARTRSKAKVAPMKSFKVAPRPAPFMVFRFTQQSFYWGLIGAAVLALGIYVASLQIRINSLYDQVDMNSTQSQLNYDEIEMLHKSLESKTSR